MTLKSGDRVRVRTMDSLKSEYGEDEDYGFANCPWGFIDAMEPCSGKEVVIKERDEDGRVVVIPPDSDVNNHVWGYYVWHESMFEPI